MRRASHEKSHCNGGTFVKVPTIKNLELEFSKKFHRVETRQTNQSVERFGVYNFEVAKNLQFLMLRESTNNTRNE